MRIVVYIINWNHLEILVRKSASIASWNLTGYIGDTSNLSKVDNNSHLNLGEQILNGIRMKMNGRMNSIVKNTLIQEIN